MFIGGIHYNTIPSTAISQSANITFDNNTVFPVVAKVERVSSYNTGT